MSEHKDEPCKACGHCPTCGRGPAVTLSPSSLPRAPFPWFGVVPPFGTVTAPVYPVYEPGVTYTISRTAVGNTNIASGANRGQSFFANVGGN